MSISKLFIHPIIFRNTNDADGPTDETTSVSILGGLNVRKHAFFKAGLDACAFEITNVGTPSVSTSAANKFYVDSMLASGINYPVDAMSLEIYGNMVRIASGALGTGLLGGSGSPIRISPDQTFSTVTIENKLDMGNKKIMNLPLPTDDTDAVNKSYIDTFLETSITLNHAVVSGSIKVPLPIAGEDAVNKLYADALTILPGTGLTKTGTTLSVSEIQTSITQVGTLGSLTVSGNITVANPTTAFHATTKNYVDSIVSDAVIPGRGLTTIAGSLSVDTAQPDITSIGPLASPVNILSQAESTSLSTGSIVASGGAAFGKSVSIGGSWNLFATSSGILSLKVPEVLSSYTLTFPAEPPASSGYALVSDTEGNLSFAPGGTSSTGSSTGTGTGSSGSGLVTSRVLVGNNQTVPANVRGLVVTKSQFMIFITAVINSTILENSSTTLYKLEGTRQQNGTFDLNVEEVGPPQGIVFNMLETGQVQYTSKNVPGWTSSAFTIQTFDTSVFQGGSPEKLSLANGISTPTDIPGFFISNEKFAHYVQVATTSTVPEQNVASLYLLEGVQQPSGAYATTTTRTGANTGHVFSATSTGQVQYTSGNIPGWLNTTISFIAIPAVSGTGSGSFDPTEVLKIENTTASVSATTGALQVLGGAGFSKAITLVGTGTGNLSQPTTGTRSSGTRCILFPQLSGSSTDFAIGMETGNMWFSSPTNFSGNGFKFYGGTIEAMNLTGDGHLSVNNGITLRKAGSFPSVTLQTGTTGTTGGITLTLPGTLPTVSGQVLSSDTTGKLSWGSPSSSTVTHEFIAGNNITTPAPVTDMVFDKMFSIDVYVSIDALQDLVAMYTLTGVPGTTGFKFFQERVGDDATGIIFSIDSSGQVSYTSENVPDWTSTVFSWVHPSSPQLLPDSDTVPIKTFFGRENVSTPEDVTSLVLTDEFSTVELAVVVLATVSLYSKVALETIKTPTGFLSMQSNVGDNIPVTFTVTPTGQVRYTSSSFPGFTQLRFRWKNSAGSSLTAETVSFLSITGTINSTSLDTGSLQVAGGCSIKKNVIVGQDIQIGKNANTTSSNLTWGGEELGGTYKMGTGTGKKLTISQEISPGSFQERLHIPDNGTTWVSSSDKRLKKDIRTLSGKDALEAVARLRPVSYRLNNESSESMERLGFIAQEMMQIVPQVVPKIQSEKTEFYGIKYTELIPLLVSAIQELHGGIPP
jgi:hypothetical protein